MNVFENKQEPTIFQLGIDEVSKAYLSETSRWGKFLAILAFIAIGLLIIAGIFMGALITTMGQSQLASTSGPVLTIVYLVMGILYIYPAWSLYKYSKLMKTSLNTSDQEQFNNALRHLKNIFKFLGILSIITLVLYGIVFLFGLIAAIVN